MINIAAVKFRTANQWFVLKNFLIELKKKKLIKLTEVTVGADSGGTQDSLFSYILQIFHSNQNAKQETRLIIDVAYWSE